MAHGVHNVCEYIAKEYQNVNDLISLGKKIILKATERRVLFKEMFPETPLLPQPVRTRWGSWQNAAEYYSRNFEKCCEFVSKLDSRDSCAIESFQKLVTTHKSSLRNDLTYISANFSRLSILLKQLEAEEILLFDSLSLIDSAIEELEQSKGTVSKVALNKFNYVLNKNIGLKQIRAINDAINGKQPKDLSPSLTPEEIASFKYAPITNCDCERSFSKYKFILNDRRYNMSELHLKYYFIVNCNKRFMN